MKTLRNVTLAIASFALIVSINACKKDVTPSPTNDVYDQSDMAAKMHPHGSPVYPITASPYGKSMGSWGAQWWKWTLGFDCANSPHANSTGSLQDQNQSGPVYFLAGAYFNTPANRSAHVGANKSIFLSVLARLDDDTTGLAASGKSLQDYLTSNAMSAVDGVDILSANLDGKDITNMFNYRAHSSLFSYTGNTAGCVLNVTGLPTPAVTDGYWLMLKPLSPGKHILHFTGGISGPGLVKDVIDTIYVSGGCH